MYMYLDSESEDTENGLGKHGQSDLPHGSPDSLQSSGVMVLMEGVHC